MVGTHRRRLQRKRQKEKKHLAAAAAARFQCVPPELLAEIHRRLDFLQRLAFASVCGASGGQNLKLETPWLLAFPFPVPVPFPAGWGTFDDNETNKEKEEAADATVLSLADGGASATVRSSENAGMRGHFTIIGSSGGWLVTADDKAALRMANPVTGAHADLPPITTVPCIHAVFGGGWFRLDMDPFLQIRFAGAAPPPPPENGDWPRSYSLAAAQMRQHLYRKVVLSEASSPGSYEAMLIMERLVGAPAFATAEDPVWRVAPSRDGVEDAIHHDGRFYSITYTGQVEAWQRDAGTGTGGEPSSTFTAAAAAVAPRMAYEHEHLRRKYLAASPEGRLMVVLKHAREVEKENPRRLHDSKDTRVWFKVQVLDRDNGRWEEAAADIGDAAIFVGVNGSLCLSTTEHRGITPGCVYFTDDEVSDNNDDDGNNREKMMRRRQNTAYYSDDDVVVDELRGVGVYSLKTGIVGKIAGLDDDKHLLWPPPVWFRPSFL